MRQFTHLLFILFLIFSLESKAQYNYPATKQIAVTDTYFGTKITDNYRWLEDLNQPEVQTWFKAQANFSNDIIGKIKGRDTLFNRMKQIQKMGGDLYGTILQRGDNYFYTKTKKEERLSKLYSRPIPNGQEILLFDPETFKAGTQIIAFEPSSDGKLVAMSLAEGGAEICDIHILRVADKKLLSDVLGPVWSEFPFQFTADNKSLFYSKMSSADKLSDDLLKNMEARLHILGTDMSMDKILASRKNNPELNILTEQFPMVDYVVDSKYVFLAIGSVKNEYLIYYAPVSTLNEKKISWKPLINFSDEITAYYIFGNQLFFLTHKNASNFKIGVTDINNPNFETATIIVKESDKVIRSIQKTRNYLIYSLSDGINQDKYQINVKTLTSTKLPMPSGVNSSSPLSPYENDRLLTYSNSWLSPSTTYEYDAANSSLVKSKWFDASENYPDYTKQFAVKEIEVKSHDGVMVPLSIIYPKNIKLDGSTPCYLTGYGAYGVSSVPYFIDNAAAFIEQGCIIAYAHVRGGAEKGEAWHQGGMKETKPNTWKDFIACAEYLVTEKYTSPQKLIGNGMSMGGILIGRAITTRPDLFAVAISEVGETNVLRSEITPNGPNQIPEVGSLKNEKEAKSIIEMDAQSKVEKGVKYPAVLVRCGMNDPRVIPWMPGKFAAVLQNSTASNKPVLLYTNYDNGHFTSDLDITFREQADMFAFALWQVGHPKFQP
jgi:prolyl oligopeptidase